MTDLVNIRVESIVVQKRLRGLSKRTVASIAESIKEIGLVNPLIVKRVNGTKTPVLVAGAHRLEAIKRLGWKMVECRLAPSKDEDRAALIEIDENLARGELSPAERAIHVAKRKEIYERLHPETKHGATPGAGRGKGKIKKDAKLASFQGDTAEKTGRSRRDIERDATRAKQIPQISGTIGTSLDEGAELDALAKMPSEQQTEIIRRAKSGQAVSAKQELKKTRRNEKEASLAETTRAASKTLGTKVYGVIYADPPWRFEPYSRKSGLGRAADNHYPTMTVDDIAAIQAPAAKDCVLFLWATAPMLPQALAIMQSWGFTYRSHCIWSKDRTGTGYWFRNRHELLLIGTRGDIPAPAQGDQYASVISAACGRHSEKPQAFAEMIEEMFPTLPRLEMFARSPRLGWDVWGNEAQAEERRCA